MPEADFVVTVPGGAPLSTFGKILQACGCAHVPDSDVDTIWAKISDIECTHLLRGEMKDNAGKMHNSGTADMFSY